MDKLTATTVFESLSSGIRLDIYRLLVRMAPSGMVAGEIATSLDIPPTNLSFHLKAMANSSLVSVVQEGRYQRYRANIPLMQDLIAYMTEECCMGSPKEAAEMHTGSPCACKVMPSPPEPDKGKQSVT